jgi:DNA polymerase-3 subunit epsilon
MSNKYVRRILNDYCVLDIETTGLSAYYDEIIEIGILRVRDNKIVDKYTQLIMPTREIDPFITALTGITNEMVTGMPTVSEVKDTVLSFLGDDVIVGHNTSFDIRFLNNCFHMELQNKYMDTMQFSRKLYPELEHHRLIDMVDYLHLSSSEHRSLADCIATKELYDEIKKKIEEDELRIEDLWYRKKYTGNKGINIKDIVATTDEIDKDGFFYGKHVVFTGKLEKMLRQEAMQLVVNLGGVLDNSVTKKTNYLILGNNDYNAILHGEKSSKHKKAEQLMLEGLDISIIDELTFYDILEESTVDTIQEDDNDEWVAPENDSNLDWRYYVKEMLDELITEYDLPPKSLCMSDNKAQKDNNVTISHTVYIWEQDYPPTDKKLPEMNKVVMNISLSKIKSRPDALDLYLRADQEIALIDIIPNDAEVLPQTKSDLSTGTIRIRFDKHSNTLVDYIRENVRYCLANYESKAGRFGCCHRYIECSDAKKCIHENLLYAKACAYRRNLEEGRVFYGPNKNV